jgi:hypothetical protein
MRRCCLLTMLLIAGISGPWARADEPQPAPPGDAVKPTESDDFGKSVRPLLVRYCLGCHGETDAEADLSLAGFRSEADAMADPHAVRRVWDMLRTEEMPPEEPFPTAKERRRMIAGVAEILDRVAREGGREPGHVVMRRLNEVEYNNTVLDLFGMYRPTKSSGGTPYEPSRGMPEQVRAVLHRDPRTRVVTLPPDDVGYGFTNNGEVLSLPPFLLEKYLAASRHVVEQLVDSGGELRTRRRDRTTIDPAEGARRFVDKFARRALGRPLTQADIQRDPEGSARRFLAAFGRRAFRRPMTDEELDRYLSLHESAAERGQPFASALKLPVQAMLVSPHFLFRAEHGIEAEEQDGLRPLNDHELAARLSYFLWSTMPDEELFRLAEEGKLRDPDVLEAQARRMLRHRYSKELGEQFGMQWMGVTGIRSAMPFPDLYPEFYKLKYISEALQLEALLLFETILVEDRSVLEFIDPGFTWMNGTLIGFYDLDVDAAGASSLFWQRYELPDKRRGGVLTLGGTMLATSLAARTSPVKRGQWVLDSLLGAPPPPPPANVEQLDESAEVAESLSLRERLEQHRSDPSCASCHRRMDGIGFGLEHFDAIGKWRDTEENGKPINAAGTLADGTTFDGVVELKELLVTERRDEFLRCLTEKLMTFALGRKLEYSDDAAVAKIVEQLKRDDLRFSSLVVGIVRSEPFRYAKAAALKDERDGG